MVHELWNFVLPVAAYDLNMSITSVQQMVNAVLDALNRNGHDVAHIDMPLSPSRVWSAMNK